jgi:hypothetical protein
MPMIREVMTMVKMDKKITSNRLEQLADMIVTMDRPGLVRTLRDLHCDFKMDFSDDFLNSMSIERLRHVVLAASLHDHNAAS